jgi:hypothetical protein
MNNEITTFNAKFNDEIKEISIITETIPIRSVKGNNEKFYEVRLRITAWKLIDSNEIFTDDNYFVTGKANNKQIKELCEKILPDSIVSLKVRQKENAFLLVEIIDNKNITEEFKNILHNQLKPIIYKDMKLGAFTLDKRENIYTKQIKWNDQIIKLEIEKYVGKRLSNIFIIANNLLQDQIIWNKKIHEFAAHKLVKLKNRTWLDEDEPKMTNDEFIKKIQLKSIYLSLKNKFKFCFDDKDIFWGHNIIITGNLEKGPIRAEIVG